MMRHLLYRPTALAFLLLCSWWGASPLVGEEKAPGPFELATADIPLGQLLEKLEKHFGEDAKVFDTGLKTRPVTVDLKAKSLAAAAVEISKQSGVGFTGLNNGVLFKLGEPPVNAYEILDGNIVMLQGPWEMTGFGGTRAHGPGIQINFFYTQGDFGTAGFSDVTATPSGGKPRALNPVQFFSSGATRSTSYLLPKDMVGKSAAVNGNLKYSTYVDPQAVALPLQKGATQDVDGTTVTITEVNAADGLVNIKYSLAWEAGLSPEDSARVEKVVEGFTAGTLPDEATRQWMESIENKVNKVAVRSVELIPAEGDPRGSQRATVTSLLGKANGSASFVQGDTLEGAKLRITLAGENLDSKSFSLPGVQLTMPAEKE